MLMIERSGSFSGSKISLMPADGRETKPRSLLSSGVKFFGTTKYKRGSFAAIRWAVISSYNVDVNNSNNNNANSITNSNNPNSITNSSNNNVINKSYNNNSINVNRNSNSNVKVNINVNNSCINYNNINVNNSFNKSCNLKSSFKDSDHDN